MSWTQIFPVLTDEMVSEYLHVATKEERREAREWLRVERMLNVQERAHVVPYALCWKPMNALGWGFGGCRIARSWMGAGNTSIARSRGRNLERRGATPSGDWRRR